MEALTGPLLDPNSTTSSSSSPPASTAVGSSLALPSALLAFLASQILKILFSWLKEKKLDYSSRRFWLVSGGMPSSICATAAAAATAIALQDGAHSPAFALALIFASIVMYDSSGIRFHTGRQAALLNQIVVELPPEQSVQNFRPLREPLGHTPLEVFVGALLGCFVASMMRNSL